MKSVISLLIFISLSSSVLTIEESSDTYLRNVVEELQFLNGVVPSDKSPTTIRKEASYTSYDQTPSETIEIDDNVDDSANNHYHRQRLPASQQYSTLPRTPQYYVEQPSQPPPQPPQQQQPQEPMPILGFTAAELAAMYRKAIERGVPMKSHNNHHHHHQTADYSFDRPKVIPALRVQQPTGYGSEYAYYFYPLNTFKHELEKQMGYHTPPAVLHEEYHTLPDSAYAATTMVDPNKKESTGITGFMSHLITGVSSFIGMAIFFFFSMFIYPRFLHMMHFPFVTTSRSNFRNELSHLAAFVTDAIDAYNQNTRQKSKQLPQR